MDSSRQIIALLLIVFSFSTSYAQRHWIATTPGNWNDPNNWSTTANGSGGASVPGPGDIVFFQGVGGRNGDCTIDIVPTVNGLNITAYTGVIDLAGNTLTTSGNNTFTGSTFVNSGAAASITLADALTTTFNGTQFDVPVSGTSNRILLSGSTFNEDVDITKISGTTDNGLGGNTFNGSVTLSNSGTAQLQLAGTNPDVFNGTLTINSNSTSSIALSRSAVGSMYNENIIINYNNTGPVTFGNADGTSTLADGRTIVVASYGPSGCGNLQLSYFTQTGTTSQSIVLDATNNNAMLSLGPSSEFNGDLVATAPRIVFNTSTFNRASVFTQTGTAEINSRGGNVFQGTTIFNNDGTGNIHLGTNAADAGDIFFGDATFNNTGGGRIRIGSYTSGNVFHQNLTLNITATADINSRTQISRWDGAETTIHGTTTINNSGQASDIHISYEAGSSTTFNGDVIILNNPTGNCECFFGNNGDVQFNSNIQVSNNSTSQIQFSANTGNVTFGDGTLSIGAGGFDAGRLVLRNFTQTGTSVTDVTLTGNAVLVLGPNALFNADFSGVAPRLFLNGATYNGTTYLEKTGATLDNSGGGNIFQGNTTLVNSSEDHLRSGVSGLDIFNGELTLINRGAAAIQLAHQVAGTVFNGNIIVNSTSGSGISFGESGGTSSLANSYSITVGTEGFTSGELALRQFTQLGTIAQSLTLEGTTILRLGPSSQFDGPVNFVSPRILLNGTTFNNVAYLEKTGATLDASNGGNIFHEITTIVNSSESTLRSGVNGADTFNGGLTLINRGAAAIQLAHEVAGTVFNENLIVNSTSGSGIFFGGNGGTSSLADGYSIAVGTDGFTSGELALRQFTQLGTTAQTLTLGGTALLRLGATSQFDGPVNFVSPRILLNGTTFNNTVYLEKNGANDDSGAGNNFFDEPTEIVNSGSGILRTGNTNPDTFNKIVTFTNSGSSRLEIAHNSAGNQFNGNIIVNSTSGSGVYFSDNANGNSTLADTRTISIGNFSSGDLRLRRFTQVGTTAQNIALSSNARLLAGPGSEFNGDVVFSSPQIFLQGAVYNGASSFEKTGGEDNNSAGGNVFNGGTQIFNSGSGDFIFGNSSFDTFNGVLTLTNSGAALIRMSESSAGNLYRNNIIVNSTSGSGIYFGNSNGTSTLASERTITVGATGFLTGDLRLRYFFQDGNTPQIMTLTGDALLRIGPSSEFNGDVTFVAPQIMLQGCIYNGITYIEKTGTTANSSYGNNIFNNTTTITNSGGGNFRLSNDNSAGNNGDEFNGDVIFIRTPGSGVLQPAYNRTSRFRRNITVTAQAGVTLGAGNGVAEFTGGESQSITKGIGAPLIFNRINMNKTANAVTLNSEINIGTSGSTFVSGVINSSANNLIVFRSGSNVTGANNASYVNGPVKKIGNVAFDFPVGKNGFYRPISISARISGTNSTNQEFVAEYFNEAPPFGDVTTWDASFYNISGCEYWILDRFVATNDVEVTLSWNENACMPDYVTNPADLRVTRWDGANWITHGNGGTTGSSTAEGTIVSSGAVTSFSPFTLASTSSQNPLPIELKRFWAENTGATVLLSWITASEINNDYFTLQRSHTGLDFKTIHTQPGAGTSQHEQRYSFSDEAPLSGISYYRLIQTDYDGNSKSWTISVQREGAEPPFTVHPNPASNEVVTFSYKATVVVINSLQQVVLAAEETESLDVSSLAAGIYIIRNQKGQITRLVKQ